MFELYQSLNSRQDIEDFIGSVSADLSSQARENSTIEYKEAHQKFSNTNEIGKDVSAFANSVGGLIFYGVKCDPNDPTKPKAITGLEPRNIETFDRVVNSSIHHPIKGIKKKLIPDHNPQVMLVYVPQSDESPHQNAGDNKYYVRLGSESKPMPHYLVELYFGKRRKPKLFIKIDRLVKPQRSSFKNNWSPRMNLQFTIQNSGKAIAKYPRAIFLFTKNQYVKPLESVSFVTDVRFRILSHFSPRKEVWEFKDNHDVIHASADQKFGPFGIQYNYALVLEPDTEENNPILEWEIYAEKMEPQKGKVILSSLFT
ncbi:AlbA family DNA-binding domain-containing protein [Nitrospira sp. Ecomares 2.1]